MFKTCIQVDDFKMHTISIDYDNDVLLIDFSYYFIYRYFALQSWFKRSETEYNEATFVKKYEDLFLSNLKKVVKQKKIKNENVILLGDCDREKIWRMELYPQYKESREKMWEKNPIPQAIFKSIHESILPILTTKQKYQFLCVETMEADDLVYCIKKSLLKSNFSKTIIMVSNDNDYLQMKDDQTEIINLPKMTSIFGRGFNDSAIKTLMMKILVGDPSDNIRGVLTKSVATKLLMTLREDECDLMEDCELKKILKTTKDCDMNHVNLNIRLIDFRCIPDSLQESITIKRLPCS